MGYIDKNLIDGESVVYQARPHWVLFMKPGFVSLVLIACAVALFYFASDSIDSDNTWLMQRIGIVLIVIAIIPIGVGAFRRSAREYAVTNRRVVMQKGV